MKLFDLVFILAFLMTLVMVVRIVINVLRGRRERAVRLLTRGGLGLGVYFAALVITSLVTPQQYYAMGEAQCSDDWCITVDRADRATRVGGDTVRVSYTLSSRARRISQRELHVASYLIDETGGRHEPVPDANAVPFDTLLGPSQSIPVARRFAVPAGTHLVEVVVTREGAGRFPGCCIIGDNGSFLHRPAVTRIAGG